MKIVDLKCAVIGKNPIVRVVTDQGISGYGEVESYKPFLKPHILHFRDALIGEDPTNVERVMLRIRQRGAFKPWGSAVSAIEMALWDVAGKAAGLPVYKLLGGTQCDKLPAYASLLKYANPDHVVRYCEEAIGRGFRDIKIHETGRDEITAAAQAAKRHKVGAVMVDVNAPWVLQEALAAVAPLRELGLRWIEEPVWPPEDFAAAAEVRAAGIPVAIGENVLSPTDFARLIDGRFVDYVQPSVAKIGGISVMRDIYTLANAASVAVVPHSAYFGPGLVATAHVTAALSRAPLVERLYCDLSDNPFGDWYAPVGGFLALPQGAGLGVDPDLRLLDKLRVE